MDKEQEDIQTDDVDASPVIDTNEGVVPLPERDWAAELKIAEDKTMRAYAELENVRRRAMSDVEKAYKYSVEKLIIAMLPVLDSLEAGLQSSHLPQANIESMREGLDLTQKLCIDTLSKFGVTEVNQKEVPFDAALHEAMVMQENTAFPNNTVLSVFQKGYQLHGRLVRPAKVVVSKMPMESQSVDEQA